LILLSDLYIPKAEKECNEDFSHFRTVPHIIVGTDNGKGFVGVELHEQFCWIAFTYGDGSIATHKELAVIINWLFSFYTEDRGIPVLYTAKDNKLKRNSYQVSDGIWQVLPKRKL
jgi:hypothetical protein